MASRTIKIVVRFWSWNRLYCCKTFVWAHCAKEKFCGSLISTAFRKRDFSKLKIFLRNPWESPFLVFLGKYWEGWRSFLQEVSWTPGEHFAVCVKLWNSFVGQIRALHGEHLAQKLVFFVFWKDKEQLEPLNCWVMACMLFLNRVSRKINSNGFNWHVFTENLLW